MVVAPNKLPDLIIQIWEIFTMRLTKVVCDKATYNGKGEKGFYAIWDAALPGFGLRITPNGSKSFIVSYRVGGRKKMLVLGRYGVLTCEQARQLARERLVQVAKGVDPAEEKKVEQRANLLMKDICLEYIERYAKVHKKSWKEDQRRVLTRLIPWFGNKRILDVQRVDVIKFHSRIGEERGKYEANRLLALISSVFEYARKAETIPLDHPNPCRMIEKFKEESREVFVNLADLPRLMDAIQNEPNPYVRAALLLYLLTGARKSELLTAKWEWVNDDRRELRLPDTKGGRPFFIHLSDPAMEILHSLPRLEGNPYIFPSLTCEGKRLWEIDKPWRSIRAKAGMEHVHIHDLRRSVGSWLAESGVSLQLIGKVLNHHDVGTTQIYARLTEDPAKAALDRLAEKVVSIVDVKAAAEKSA
jgi:integrase